MEKVSKLSVVLFASLLLVFVSTSCFADADNATREEVVNEVQEAIQMVKDKGVEATLKEIGDKNGKFVWKDSYVFALKADNAETVAHPMKPNLIGKNLLHVKDKNGVMLFAEFAKIGTSASGKGWVDYVWPKPGEKVPSPKHSYIEKVPGENLVFGAGYHD